MKKPIYSIVLCLLTLQASAQFNLEFHSGYGSYSNDDLKKYQASLMNGYLSDAEILESFPAFWYYGVDAKWNLPHSQVGLSLSQGSTGGQVYYADYSGTFKEQQLLNYTALRILTSAKFAFNNGNTFVQFDPRFGLVFADLQITRSITATDGTESIATNQSSNFDAVNPFIEPTLSISQKVGAVGINFFIGYHTALGSDIFRESNGQPLVSNGVEVPMNLSGVRAGGSIGVYFGRAAKEIDFTRVYMSLGAGLDFGGIGLNAMNMVTEYLGLFAGLGYNLNNIGINTGVRLYTNDQIARSRLFFSAMYGYNAVYLIKNAENYNRTFYGTTIGMGLDVKDSRSNFWTLALQIPVRSDDVKSYKTYLENSNIEIKHDLLPITISLGYRIAVVK